MFLSLNTETILVYDKIREIYRQILMHTNATSHDYCTNDFQIETSVLHRHKSGTVFQQVSTRPVQFEDRVFINQTKYPHVQPHQTKWPVYSEIKVKNC